MKVCPSCGRENPDDARFCSGCATPLEAATGREERKVVTVLFCDLVGSTAQAERLDPEDVRALLSRYHERVKRELERFGGTVEKFIGDAVMALFGAPVAHEDDPERAVRAALAVRDWAEEEGDLQVRIGITTGEALITLGARPERGEGMAAGDVVNTAARLQAAAPENGVVVDESTQRATDRAIDYADPADVEARGKARSIRVWRALQARSRFGVDVDQRAATQLVGRRSELELLVGTLERVKRERESQLVTLVGVPGIGKSRLVYELFSVVDAASDLVYWRQGRSLPYGEGVAFWAIGEIAKAHAGVLESDAEDVAADKLADAVAVTVAEEDRAWVEAELAPLIGLRAPGATPSERATSFAAWRQFFEGVADRHPLVLVFEDLHWADDHVLDFVDYLTEWVTGVPLLVLATARPELLIRRPTWGGGKANATTLRVGALSDDETAELLRSLFGTTVPREVGADLLARAEGNPLYAEEFVRVVMERGTASLPESVQGLIAARLDALPDDEKLALQDAAVLGKVFWTGALAAIGSPAAALDETLHSLERKEFVRRERRSSVAREAEHAFRHAIVRDVAYAQIPRVARASKHRAAAGWIESLGRPDDHAEMLAHHYSTALDLVRAAGGRDAELDAATRRALAAAGDRAAALNAFATAVAFYERALELSPEGDATRPHLLLSYGRALRWDRVGGEAELESARDAFVARGDIDAAVESEVLLADLALQQHGLAAMAEHVAAAVSLAKRTPNAAARAHVLKEVARMHLLQSKYADAIRAGREAIEIAAENGLEDVLCHALNTLGSARAHGGDSEGLHDILRSIEIAQERGSAPDVGRGYTNLAAAAAFLGDERHSALAAQEGLHVVRRMGVEAAASGLLGNRPGMLFARGDWDAALAAADEYLGAQPSHWRVGGVRAEIWYGRGELDRAASEARVAVKAEADAGFPRENLITVGVVELARGNRAAAEDAAAELAELEPAQHPVVLAWPTHLALLVDLGCAERVRPLLDGATAGGGYVEAARHILDGAWDRAADVYQAMGIRTYEAFARLRAAEQAVSAGRRDDADAQLVLALAFYRSVGATYFVQRGEALLARSE